jgi:hypothetical protein
MKSHPKYIVYVNEKGDEIAVIFDQGLRHADVAATLKGEILGAGLLTPEFECYGRAVDIQVESRPELDADRVKGMFGI